MSSFFSLITLMSTQTILSVPLATGYSLYNSGWEYGGTRSLTIVSHIGIRGHREEIPLKATM